MRRIKRLSTFILIRLFVKRAVKFSQVKNNKLWTAVRISQASNDGVGCLKRLLPHANIDLDLLRQYMDELKRASSIRESVEKHRHIVGWDWEERWDSVTNRVPYSAVLFCYAALRFAKPEIVVETGCYTGWTSALILFALHQNNKGHLFTIDIPAQAGELSMIQSLPEGCSPGFLVPDELRGRWTLTLGDSRDHLIPLLKKHAQVGVFFHDSDHTYEHMMWEFTSVWSHLEPGGLLISDDISQHTAFWDFATAMKRSTVIHRANLNFGVLSKAI